MMEIRVWLASHAIGLSVVEGQPLLWTQRVVCWQKNEAGDYRPYLTPDEPLPEWPNFGLIP